MACQGCLGFMILWLVIFMRQKVQASNNKECYFVKKKKKKKKKKKNDSVQETGKHIENNLPKKQNKNVYTHTHKNNPKSQ